MSLKGGSDLPLVYWLGKLGFEQVEDLESDFFFHFVARDISIYPEGNKDIPVDLRLDADDSTIKSFHDS